MKASPHNRWTGGFAIPDKSQGHRRRSVALADPNFDPETVGLPRAINCAELVRTFLSLPSLRPKQIYLCQELCKWIDRNVLCGELAHPNRVSQEAHQRCTAVTCELMGENARSVRAQVRLCISLLFVCYRLILEWILICARNTLCEL